MAKDSSQLAKEYIDGTLKARASLGRSAKPSKAAYARAIRMARLAMDELMSLGRRKPALAPVAVRRKTKSPTRAK
jgi:hypothetical protein